VVLLRVVLALLLTAVAAACMQNEPPAQLATVSAPRPSPSIAVPPDRWRAVLIAGDSSSPAFNNGVETMRDRLASDGVRNISLLAADPSVVARAELARLPQRMADRTLLLDILGDALRQAVGVEPPTVRPEVRVGAWFGYKPAFVPGALTLKGRPVDRAQYVDLLVAEGVDVHVPSVPPLRDLPLFQTTPPLRIAELAWKPQLEASYPGLDAYIAHRLSVPAFSFPEQAEVVAQYAAAFAKIGAVLGGPDAAKDDR
jgi:hypothetical protein